MQGKASMEISSKAQLPNHFDTATNPSWNPLRCTGTGLPTNLAIMVKVLAIAVLVTNHVRLLPDPWLSFIPAIDLLPPALFQKTIQVVFFLSALAIIFNRRIQWASLAIGTTMLMAVVSSKAYYGNNKTFCGLMFFLAGLYKPGGPPFIRWQLALTYFGAGLNKLLDPDWQTGVFFEFWSVHKLHEHVYLAIDALLPKLWLGRLMCWFTIFTELGVVPFLLSPPLYYWGALLNILFQCGLCLFVGNTFTLFFYAMSAASLAFVTWPSSQMTVLYMSGRNTMLRRFLQWIDLDHRFTWRPIAKSASVAGAIPLELISEGKSYSGLNALRMIVLFNPVTYFVFTAAMAASGYKETSALAIYRRILLGVALALLMPPLAWIADRLTGTRIEPGQRRWQENLQR
jgi:hypothetical protein